MSMSVCLTVSICPLINQSSTSVLVVNITLALSFNSSNDARSPVSDCFRFCACLISEILEFLGNSSFAGIAISCPGMFQLIVTVSFNWCIFCKKKKAKCYLDNMDHFCQLFVMQLDNIFYILINFTYP